MATPDVPDPRPDAPSTASSAPAQPPATVTDRRPPARAALPRSAQMWLMLGIAGVLLGVIVLTGNPEPKERAAPVPATPAPVDTQRVTGYQSQLAQRERELAREMATLEQPKIPTNEIYGTGTPQQSTQQPVDPLADERRRREYQSLFASNVALSTRPQTSDGGTAPSSMPPPSGDSTLDAMEAQARESLARLRTSVNALERAAVPAVPQASAVAATPPAPREDQSNQQRPATTPPLRPGADRHVVLEGTVLEGVLMTRLDGDFTGPVICLISTPLYSHYGDALLIPAGSKVLGEARAVDTWGQRRLAVSFHRLILPDGATHSLDKFTGLNQVGDSGLKDRVNHHYWSTFGTAAAVGLVSGLAQYLSAGVLTGGDGDGDRTVIIAGAGADASAQSVAQVLNRYTNRLPTITIREGHRLKVYVTQDLEFPAYHDIRRSPITPGGL